MNGKISRVVRCTLFAVLVSVFSNTAWPYVMRVDRFEVSRSGQVIFVDEFSDGLAGGWTNSNGVQTFGTWTEESGTGFARLESPGLFFPGLPGVPIGASSRTDIFSNLIPASQVAGGPFRGVVTLDSVLPEADQSFVLSLNYFRPGASLLSDNVFVGLGYASAARAATLGINEGLYFFEGHINYGTPLTIASVTDFHFVSVPLPNSVGSIQLEIDYTEVAGNGLFTAGYRFADSDPFVTPLTTIASTAARGFWDIGTSQVVSEPGASSLLVLGLAILGLFCTGGTRTSGSAATRYERRHEIDLQS